MSATKGGPAERDPGRRYHARFGDEENLMATEENLMATEENLMATDEKEQDRVDLHHQIMLLLLGGKPHKAPLHMPRRMLDIGAGTGSWAVTMADRYPMAEVIGIDLCPIRPSWVPENCRFEVDDADASWAFPNDYFDFIHARNLAQPTSAVPEVMRDMYRCTRRGGYVELAETEVSVFCDDGTMAETNALKRALDLLTSAKVKAGAPPATAEALTARLADVGFVDISVATIKQPVGPWVKDIVLERVGALTLLAYETDFEAQAVTTFTRVFGIPTLEAAQLCRDALRDARDANYHMYCKFHVAWGRKPETDV